MSREKLDRIFNPESIAVIGASSREGSVGNSVMRNLIGRKFKGCVYPVNLKRKSVMGVRAYSSVTDIPDEIDLAIIAIPAVSVPGVVEECGKKGVQGIVILSAGFKEIGKEGQRLEKEIRKIADKYRIRIIGPNCLGFMKPEIDLNASFSHRMALKGRIAFISQSGALGTAVLDWAIRQNVGMSYFISIGSMIDVGFHDLIDYLGQDPNTDSILIYMESLKNARKFLSAARAFARNKPIIVLKVGKSSEGAKAARSHTGSLAGNDAVYDAAFKRAGIVRVKTLGELFNLAHSLDMQKRPKGNKLAIVTNAGGPGVIATDYLIANGGKVAELSNQTLETLNKALPKEWSHNNPIDVLGDATPDRYKAAVEACLDDKNVDAILVILTPQDMTNATKIAKEIVALPNKSRKTILAAWMGSEDVEEGRNALNNGDIPVYAIPENAVRCFINMHNYSKNLELLYETPATIPHAFKPNTKKNLELIKGVAKKGRFVLTEKESKELLENYGIPIAKSGIAKNASESVKVAEKLKYPVTMKILSPDILHKTDVGGVKLNLNSREQVRKAFREIMTSVKKNAPRAKIDGVFMEKMTDKRYELLIGAKKDPIFGPSIVFGMGGVAVEIFKDTTIGLPPLNMALAMRMIEETKIYNLLKGYRGMKKVDIASIQFLLYKFSYLVMDFPEIKEIDINPFAVDDKGGIVLDAKVILDEKIAGKKVKPYSHLVISPYPKEYVKEERLKNGKKVVLRPIRPEDEPMEREMFKTFSDETQRFRFFQQIKNISHDMLIRYTQIDYDREMAIIAEINEKGKKRMAGVVRLIADPYNETAEFAIVVGDPWHKQGLGNKFTDYILEIAKEKRIKKVYANVLKDNHIMLHMFKKRGFSVNEDDGMMYCELKL